MQSSDGNLVIGAFCFSTSVKSLCQKECVTQRTIRICIALLCLGLSACGVVRSPDWRLVRQYEAGQSIEKRLADIDVSYAKGEVTEKLVAEEQALLQAWLDGIEGKSGELSRAILEEHAVLKWEGFEPKEFARLLPSPRIRPRFTEQKRVRAGIGLPVAIHVENPDSSILMELAGRTYAATVRLNYRGEKKPELVIINSLKREVTMVGGRSVALAADFSSHADLFWEVSSLDDEGIAAMFRPGGLKRRPQLYLTEDYDPEKIPLVLVHGLTSSPSIYAPLGSELRSRKALRDRYQIWHFAYPTGTPWINSASSFRDEIRIHRKLLDPAGTNSNWDNMLVVGHSMGGLVTRTAVSENSKELYEVVFDRPLDQLRGSQRKIEKIRRSLLAEPLPEPKRVIFIATPHRGSSMADWGIIHLLSSFILLPADLVQDTFDVITLNQFAVSRPMQTLDRLPTGLDTLSPRSPFIKALDKMQIRDNVKVHSIVGVKDFSLFGGLGDGIVPYSSAHLDDVETELVVDEPHSMVEKPEVVAEVIRLLEVHAGLGEPAAQ